MAGPLTSRKKPLACTHHQLFTSILASALLRSFGQCYCELTGIHFSVRKRNHLWYQGIARRKWHRIRGCVHFVSEVVARWDHILSVDAAIALHVRFETEDFKVEVVIAAFLNGILTTCRLKRQECKWRLLAYLDYKSIHPYGRCGLHICR